MDPTLPMIFGVTNLLGTLLAHRLFGVNRTPPNPPPPVPTVYMESVEGRTDNPPGITDEAIRDLRSYQIAILNADRNPYVDPQDRARAAAAYIAQQRNGLPRDYRRLANGYPFPRGRGFGPRPEPPAYQGGPPQYGEIEVDGGANPQGYDPTSIHVNIYVHGGTGGHATATAKGAKANAKTGNVDTNTSVTFAQRGIERMRRNHWARKGINGIGAVSALYLGKQYVWNRLNIPIKPKPEVLLVSKLNMADRVLNKVRDTANSCFEESFCVTRKDGSKTYMSKSEYEGIHGRSNTPNAITPFNPRG